MRRFLLLLYVLLSVWSFAYGEQLEVSIMSEKEINFRGIKWGTSFTEIEAQNSSWGLRSQGGNNYDVKSVSNILDSDIYGYSDKYEFKDIRIYGKISNGAVNVAGFTTTRIDLYFVRVPVDGILIKSDENTALYGARYSFEKVKNIKGMEAELIRKLSELYGQPGATRTATGLTGYVFNYTYWYGANDTAVCIRSTNSKYADHDDLHISYVWLKGDDLLQQAHNAEIARIEAENQEVEKLIEDNISNYDGL